MGAAMVWTGILLSSSAWAQEALPPPPRPPVAPVAPKAPVAPTPPGEVKVSMDFGPDASLYDLVLFFAQLRQLNLILTNVDELRERRVSIVSTQPVTVAVAWATFLEVLASEGYRLDQTGGQARIVKASEGIPDVVLPPR